MARLAILLGLLLLAAPAFADPVSLVIAAVFATTIVEGVIVFSFTAFLTTVAVQYVVGQLAGKPNGPGAQLSQPNFQAEARDRLQVVRSAVETRRIIYGQVMVSGPLVYAETTGATHEYLHMVIPLAGHQCQEIGDVYLNDEALGTLDGSGNVTTGRFSGFVRVKKLLGTAAQAADADLVAESAGIWTSAHRLRGVTYIYIRLLFDQNVFPTGIPNVRALVKGKLLYDPRVSGSPTVTAWSDNWTLVIRDYLSASYGFGCTDAEIDDVASIVAANISDEAVQIVGSPIETQARYTCNGTVNLADKPIDIMRNLLTGGAGACCYSQGVYRIFAGAYVTPTLTLDESWLKGGVKLQPTPARRDLFNGVRGTFVDPNRGWQPTDFPAQVNATYATQDGSEILRDIELAYTTDVTRAQRIAKIHLEKSRQGITVAMTCNLNAFRLAVLDTVMVTISRLGWTSKVFIVMEWAFNENGGIDLVLQEEASSCYDWAMGDATVVDTAPDTELPSPFTGLTISGLTATSGTADLLLNGDGTVVPRVHLRWTTPANPYVKEYELQFAASAGSPQEWVDVPKVVAPAVEGYAMPVKDGVAYDLRVRAATTIGNAGAWSYVLAHTVVGKTELPSNVTGFSAQQNDTNLNFKWTQIADVDLAGYEIRYNDPGSTDWASAIVVTSVTRGTAITNGFVPPGTWMLLLKARDTSFNYSANAAQFPITVGNSNDVISSIEESPGWLGSRVNLVYHWTGKLVPDSQSLASALGWEVFDQAVPNPYSSYSYTAPVYDQGFDDTVRVWANIVSALAPGETGADDPLLNIDYRTASGSFDGFEGWTIGDVTARYIQHRIAGTTAGGIAILTGFETVVDAHEYTQQAQALTVAAGGTAVVFPTQFHAVPNIQVTAQLTGSPTSPLFGVYESPTALGFTAHVFNPAGADVGGVINWQATGA